MRLFMTILTLAFLIAAPVRAEDDKALIQRTISDQIVAFLNDDAETAYSFAAPGIQNRFPDKELFFAMVKKSYAPVYRPGNYAFGRFMLVERDAMAFQEVLITGMDGQDWKAVYKLLRQPDQRWKIGGVGIFPNKDSKGI